MITDDHLRALGKITVEFSPVITGARSLAVFVKFANLL